MPVGLATRKAIEQAAKEVCEIGDSIRTEAIARLAKARLRMPDRPLTSAGQEYTPRLPADLTRLTNREIGQLHGQFCAMVAYAHGCVAIADVEHSIRLEAYNLAKTKALLASGEDKLYLRRAESEVDEHLQKLNRVEMVANATLKLMQSVLDGYVVGKECTSREMARRIDLESREPR